jgi:nicotinate-nucleotide adenylyltransferase
MNHAVLGGTFDPVHAGHLMVAEVVRAKLAPVEVVFVPAGQPWLKQGRPVSSAADRLAMVALAVDAHPGLRVSSIEIERGGPTYTVDTIRDLRAGLPLEDELYFIVGWDNLLDMGRWHSPAELVMLCKLVAVPRVGYRVPDKETLDKILPGLSKRVILLDKPEVDISASVIRERARLGQSLAHLVPPSVENYIKEKGLYC